MWQISVPIFALLTLGAQAGAPAQPVQAGATQLGALLKTGMAKGYPGAAMLVENSDGKIFSAAAGYSDLEHHTPMRTTDGFHIASISKTFAAASTLRLIDQGKLSLNATLASVLGDAVAAIPNSDRITVAQLLDHSSGIYPTNNDMDYVTTLLGPKADPHRIWTPAELVALANQNRQKPVAEPGTGHHYSDTNYILLGMVVEKVSGTVYKEYVKKTFLEPLKMRSTYFYSDFLAGKVQPQINVVQGYLVATKDIRKFIDINPMFNVVPDVKVGESAVFNTTLAAERIDTAGGIVTTLDDLAKFARVLFRGKLLSAPSQKYLMSSGEGMDALPIDKQRTWTLQATHKRYGVLVFKEGDGPGGVNTLMAYLPAKDEIFVGFINSFGNFNEVDFMMDEVIAGVVAAAL